MAQCETDSTWTIALTKDNLPGDPDFLFFKLHVAAGVVTGQVFLPNQPGTPLSDVSGSCQSVNSPDVTILTLIFRWGAVSVFMTGFTHTAAPIHRFRGRFLAFAAVGPAPQMEGVEETLSAQLLALAPDPGDTGTGTGQQT